MGDVFESEIAEWFLTGRNPKGYEAGDGHLKSRAPNTVEFGTLMTRLPTSGEAVKDWLGKRVKLRAEVRTENVVGWAGVWMRVDGAQVPPDPPPMLAFSNMQDRPILGTSDWSPYELVLDVASDAKTINFGLALHGDGEAWVRAATIEVVGNDVPQTAKAAPIARGAIGEDDLEPFLISLAWILGENFDDVDWASVRDGVAASDEAAGRKFEVEIFAARGCKVKIGRDAKENILHVHVEPPRRHLHREIGLALEIFGTFVVTQAARSCGLK
jgi:hypothetical protein